MAPKTTLNAKNLEALGAERLAELLIEISTGSAASKSRLRLELAGSQGSAEAAREVRKRLSSIQRAKTFINWRKVKAVKANLETQRKAIAKIAADDPEAALDLIWQFLGLAESIFERSDDGNGTLIESFHQACVDAGMIAKAAKADEAYLAEKVFGAIQNNGYGQYDRLIAAMAGALGDAGLVHLRTLVTNWLHEPEEKPNDDERSVIAWGMNGPIYEDEVYGRHRDLTVQVALQAIADAQGDVDAYIAQQSDETRKAPMIAADIATRLIGAGRAGEALAALDAADDREPSRLPYEWQQVRVEALEALDRSDEAQNFRWTCFEQSLNEDHLRAYLKRLPDFDDIEAEEKAFSCAQTFPDVHQALAFFLNWPAQAEASKLILNRFAEIDGDFYGLLTAASEELADKYPLAATLLLRAMISFSLDYGRSSRYKHAARHFIECGLLARQIESFGDHPQHDDYAMSLRKSHGRKTGFWGQVL
jgi:hypothetical protein